MNIGNQRDGDINRSTGYWSRLIRPAAAVVVGWLLNPELHSALAQYTANLAEREKKPVLEWVVATGFVVLVIGIAFMNPKRSHLA